jgi:hypothetical protein
MRARTAAAPWKEWVEQDKGVERVERVCAARVSGGGVSSGWVVEGQLGIVRSAKKFDRETFNIQTHITLR